MNRRIVLLLVSTMVMNVLSLTTTATTTTIATRTSTTTTRMSTPWRRRNSNWASSMATAEDNNADADVDTAAQSLLDRAAQLREEIAALEDKTVEQVQAEAKAQKDEERQRQAEQAQRSAKVKEESKERLKTDGSFLEIPNRIDDMIRQASRAVERAFQEGQTRQTVRFNLVAEDQSPMEENQWPGGAQQMYREAGGPLTAALLREIRAPTKDLDVVVGGQQQQRSLAPTLLAQDILDFDGSALHTAQAKEGAHADVQALVMANTDKKYLQDIQEISTAMGPRLFLLVNPFWRNVDSWGFNILAPKAKERAQEVIFDQGYEETYVLMVFQVRGETCAAIKAYPYDWQIFAFLENAEYPSLGDSAIRLGSSKTEPTSSQVTEWLNARPEFQQTKTMRQLKF